MLTTRGTFTVHDFTRPVCGRGYRDIHKQPAGLLQLQTLLINTDSDRKRPGLHGRKYTGECALVYTPDVQQAVKITIPAELVSLYIISSGIHMVFVPERDIR